MGVPRVSLPGERSAAWSAYYAAAVAEREHGNEANYWRFMWLAEAVDASEAVREEK